MSIVMKFGGTSVADASALENVARIVAAQRERRPVVVVSAMSGVTDALLKSVVLASERQVDEAIASLKETFARHQQAAEQSTVGGQLATVPDIPAWPDDVPSATTDATC